MKERGKTDLSGHAGAKAGVRSVLLLLVLALLLPAAYFVLPEGDLARPGAFAEEDSRRERALSAAMEQSTGEEPSRLSSSGTASPEGGEGVRCIVRFSETLSEEELSALLDGVNARPLAQSSERLFQVFLPDPDAFEAQYGDALLYLSEDRLLASSELPTDPKLAERTEYAQLNLFSAWERVTPSSDVLVAVLDTGVDRAHEELSGAQILSGYDVLQGSAGVSADRDGHGTSVIGLIAASANNGVGSAGVAYGVRILPIRIADKSKAIYSSDLISGIRFAADAGARIINLSLGGYEYSEAEYDAVRYALERGCILIAAAGNDGEKERAEDPVYPASYPGVIAVGSCGADGALSSFSQRSDTVDLLAPGENLLLLAADGEGENAYRYANGTSYSAALLSGVAALALSALDDGVRMNAEELEVLLADGRTRRVGVGYGPVDALQAVEDANLPIVTGVQDGATYTDRVTVHFNRGEAFLDGEEFFDGDMVFRSGGHTLVVDSGEFRRTVSFRILYTPASYEMNEGEHSVSFTYAGGDATLDGFPYVSGETITAPGWHLFRLTDPLGGTTEHPFYCDFRVPTVSGVTNGGVYRQPVRIRVAGSGSALLDGEELRGETVVSADGEHILTLSNAGTTRVIRFTLDTDVRRFENTVARSGVLCDAENGWYAVYSEMLIGLRVFDLETGEFLRFLDTETVRGTARIGGRLLIFGEWQLTVLDPTQMRTGGAVLASYEIRCDGFASVGGEVYCLSDGILYRVRPETGDWASPAGNFVLSPLLEANAEELYADGDTLWFYSIGENRFDRYADGEVTSFDLPFEAAGERKLFADGLLFCGGYAARTEDFMPVFTFEGNPLAVFDGLLFTTKAVYRLADGVLVGGYAGDISCVTREGEEVFVCGDAGGISRYPTENGFGFAPAGGTLLAETAESDRYTRFFTLYEQANAADSGAVGNRFGAVFSKERKLLLFRSGALEREVELPFSPAGICLSENGCAVWSADGNLLWMDGTVYSFSEPIRDVFYRSGSLWLIAGGRLYRSDGNVWADTGIAAEAAAGTANLLVWLSDGALSAQTARGVRSVPCDASTLYTDGTYILADRDVYRASDLTLLRHLSAEVLDLSGRTVLLSNGLYSLDDDTVVFPLELGVLSSYDACLGEACGLVLLHTGSLSVSGYDHPIWELPSISGADDGGRYDAQTVIRYDRGYGYLDGQTFRSGTQVTEPGMHTFLLVLPSGIQCVRTFTVVPAAERIAFFNDLYRCSVGDSGQLRVRVYPTNANPVSVVFSSDSDCIRLESDGRFVAQSVGTATVTARSADGRLRASCVVSVQSSLLRFDEESGYRIDRENGFLYGVPAGTEAEELLSHLQSDGTPELPSGVVGTGAVLALFAEDGAELDRLTVVVQGDLDGDGYVTLLDLRLLEQALSGGTEMDALFTASADINESGVVSDKDANLLERMLLRGEGNAGRGIPPSGRTGTVGMFLPSVVQTGSTLHVTLYLKDSTRASCAGCEGVSGRLEYPSALTYLGAETYGWEVSLYESGGAVSYLAFGERSEGTIPLVTLRFSVDAEAAGEAFSLRLDGGVVLQKGKACGISAETAEFVPTERVYGDVQLHVVGMTEPFSPEKKTYEVYLPVGTPALDYTVVYPAGGSVTVRNTVFDRTNELDAVFTFRLPNGEKLTYTIHAVRDGAPPPGSDARLASLTAEGIAFPFSPSVTLYELTVPYGIERLALHWETMDEQASAVCDSPALLPGKTANVTVTVTAVDGTQIVYTLRVYRLLEGESEMPPETSGASVSPQGGASVWTWVLLIAVLAPLVGGSVAFLVRAGRKERKKSGKNGKDDPNGTEGMA